MIALVPFLVALAGLVASVYLLGFRLGGQHWHDELTKVRLEGAQAERELHNLTRQAFVAMAEHAERQRGLRP